MADDVLDEIWLPVVGYEDFYEVSSFGRVRSVPREVVTTSWRNTTYRRIQKGFMRKLMSTPLGYQRVHLSKLGKSEKLEVQVLVCEAFHGPRPDGFQAAHNDGNPRNNREGNIRWATPKENSDDRWLHNTMRQGTDSHLAKLTEAEVLEIRASSENGPTLAAKYGLEKTAIYRIRRRQSWAHI